MVMKQHADNGVIAKLIEQFDCVLLLDDGATNSESDGAMMRSDAMRLRMVLPVVVVAPQSAAWAEEALPAAVEHFPVASPLDAAGVELLVAYLAERGVAKPLLWFAETSANHALFAAW
ncbi:MAG: hypothetical protein JO067_03350, partial [Cupriavidus sp.]|nr:hypothetical protein [Cupriavidus sp.]